MINQITCFYNNEVLIDYSYVSDLNGNRLPKVSSKHSNFYTYDPMNRFKEAIHDGKKESFTYTKEGNRLTKAINDIAEKYISNNTLSESARIEAVNKMIIEKQGDFKQTIHEENLVSGMKKNKTQWVDTDINLQFKHLEGTSDAKRQELEKSKCKSK